MRTTSSTLQAQLSQWSEALTALASTPLAERREPLLAFVRTFVPPDVTEDDIDHFTHNLFSDEEFFLSFVREIGQCASGEGVEKIEGNQQMRAEFIILPSEGVLSPETTLDIVRQVAFICTVSGQWRAEA